MENTANTNKRSKAKKWLLGGLGVLALGTLTYFGIDYFYKNKSKKAAPAKPKVKPPLKKQAPAPPKKTVPPKPKAPVKTASKKEAPKQQAPNVEASFPLKKGDRGKLIRELRLMLNIRFGEDWVTNLITKQENLDYFDSDLEKILRDLRVPVVNGQVILTEAKYKELMRPDPEHSKNLAGFFRQFITGKNFKSVLSMLKNIRNVEEYKSISSFYVKFPPYKSLLSAVFVVFKDVKEQQQLRSEFLRIGITYDGQKWTLNGMKNNSLIITTQATTVWKDAKTSVPVPAKMVLGNEITRRGDFTLFENEGRHFLVESKTVKAYQP